MTRTEINKRTKDVPLINNAKQSEADRFWIELPFIVSMMGIQFDQKPEFYDLQRDSLRALITDNYGYQLTFDEFKYALELYALGKIDITGDSHHFGRFNLKFFGELLKQYTEMKRSLPKDQNYIGQANQLPEKPMSEYEKEFYIGHLKHLQGGGNINDSSSFWFTEYYKAYNHLVRTEQIVIDQAVRKQAIVNANSYVNLICEMEGSPELRASVRKTFTSGEKKYINLCKNEYYKLWMEEKMKDLNFIESELKRLGH